MPVLTVALGPCGATAIPTGKLSAMPISGARKTTRRKYVSVRCIAGSRNTVYSDFGAGYLELEYERVRSEWPPKVIS